MRGKNPGAPFAKKSFGQNFLEDARVVEKIIRALDPQAGETIVEIGPGRGALTEKIVERAGCVLAIELDRDLIPLLREKFAGARNFELIESDALKIDYRELVENRESRIEIPNSEIPNSESKLVANLPYYISTAILQKLIAERSAFREMILMFQREVVERITAEPGNSERGFLTVLTEAYLAAEKLFNVPPAAFRPQPKVHSAVVRLRPKPEDVVFRENEELFRSLVSAAFSQKRKTILNNLRQPSLKLKRTIENPVKILDLCRIDPKRRAETLTLEEWKRMVEVLAENQLS